MDGPLTTMIRATKVNISTKAVIMMTSTRMFRYRSRPSEASFRALPPPGSGWSASGPGSGAGVFSQFRSTSDSQFSMCQPDLPSPAGIRAAGSSYTSWNCAASMVSCSSRNRATNSSLSRSRSKISLHVS